MTCAEFQRKLSAYTDGELSQWTRWKVQNHLGCCPECSELMQELDEVDECLMGALAEQPAPTYLTDAVMRRLPAMPPAWRRPGTTLRWATGVTLAGVQLLAVYGAYWWGFARGSSTPSPDQRGGVTSPMGVSGRTPAFNGPRSAAPVTAPVSLWGRESLAFPFSATEVEPKPQTIRRKPITAMPVLQPGGAH